MAKPLNTQIIEGAIDLISDPRCWCKNTAARDRLGRNVLPTDEEAVRWCAYGALIRAARDVTGRDYNSAVSMGSHIAHDIDDARASFGDGDKSLEDVNDFWGHQTIIEVLKAHLERQ